MVNQAKILYDIYKRENTLSDMNIKVKVYGHDLPADLTIYNGVVTLKYSDGTSETYPEA